MLCVQNQLAGPLDSFLAPSFKANEPNTCHFGKKRDSCGFMRLMRGLWASKEGIYRRFYQGALPYGP